MIVGRAGQFELGSLISGSCIDCGSAGRRFESTQPYQVLRLLHIALDLIIEPATVQARRTAALLVSHFIYRGDMPARLHAIVEHADDLDEAWFYHAVEDHMHRVRHRRLAAFAATVPDVKAADAGPQLTVV
ncbi:MAG: hypothetical protein WB822_15925 [Rhodoplanes sp.]